jgi:hypothetical protein
VTTRQQAIRICAIAASTCAPLYWVCEGIGLYRSKAEQLARAAFYHADTYEPMEGAAWRRLWAEAECLLREGWTPCP